MLRCCLSQQTNATLLCFLLQLTAGFLKTANFPILVSCNKCHPSTFWDAPRLGKKIKMEYLEMNEISEFYLSYHLFIKFVQPLNYFQTK